MGSNATNDAKHWRERAAQMRALADTTKDDPETVAKVLRLAADYEELADRADIRTDGGRRN
jgi:hypothetical protein